jgi:hypothetical protein
LERVLADNLFRMTLTNTHPCGRRNLYYGYIEEIWELDYGRGLKVPLFRCKWVNLTRGGVTEDPQYRMTTVDLNNLAYADEPFVLANDVAKFSM